MALDWPPETAFLANLWPVGLNRSCCTSDGTSIATLEAHSRQYAVKNWSLMQLLAPLCRKTRVPPQMWPRTPSSRKQLTVCAS